MCEEHWTMLSADLRRKISQCYRRGKALRQTDPDWLLLVVKAGEAIRAKYFEVCVQSHGASCGCWQKAADPVATRLV